MAFSQAPIGASLDVQSFKISISEEELFHFEELLRLSSVGPATFENTSPQYGLSKAWLENAKEVWLNGFKWRAYEARINSFPSFKTTAKDGNSNDVDIHFLALFSKKADAMPIMLLHGWPSCILDFLDMLDLLRAKYTPDTLPYHVIVPSLPGYGYSSIPLIDYSVDLAASALNNLMIGLGFHEYVAQGGDLGSFISRSLANTYDSCIGIHLNMMGVPYSGVLPEEGREALKKATDCLDTGFAFLPLQATRPATVGHVLSSSPLALLSWIGEKYLEWTDVEPPLERILEVVTFYWFTNTASRCMYHNRSREQGSNRPVPNNDNSELSMKLASLRLPYVSKPTGYSMFPREIIPVPMNWAAGSCNIVSFSQHEHGGHFAAMEQPQELLSDVETYIKRLEQFRKTHRQE